MLRHKLDQMTFLKSTVSRELICGNSLLIIFTFISDYLVRIWSTLFYIKTRELSLEKLEKCLSVFGLSGFIGLLNSVYRFYNVNPLLPLTWEVHDMKGIIFGGEHYLFPNSYRRHVNEQ